MSDRKGQEEVVGFAVVVVLVAVVFVLFLGFSSHEKPSVREKTSQDLRNYLESIRVTTTECKLSEPLFQDFKSLITLCYQGQACTSGKKACEVLNSTTLALLSGAFSVGQDHPIKGYRFVITYSELEEKQDSLITLSEGNCSSLSQRSADDFFPLGRGQVTSKITTCY